MANKRFRQSERRLEMWSQPDSVIVRALQILIPESELRMSLTHENKKVTWLETPPPGRDPLHA